MIQSASRAGRIRPSGACPERMPSPPTIEKLPKDYEGKVQTASSTPTPTAKWGEVQHQRDPDGSFQKRAGAQKFAGYGGAGLQGSSPRRRKRARLHSSMQNKKPTSRCPCAFSWSIKLGTAETAEGEKWRTRHVPRISVARTTPCARPGGNCRLRPASYSPPLAFPVCRRREARPARFAARAGPGLALGGPFPAPMELAIRWRFRRAMSRPSRPLLDEFLSCTACGERRSAYSAPA